jgi:tRNA (guanine9-N1)-methyltransferase
VSQLFSGASLVVLSPDAPEPLEGPLDENAIYVVGGIIDRSVIKGLTLGWAAAAGARAARLPVREHSAALGLGFSGASTAPVLSVSDVVAALVSAHASGGDWGAALAAALPARFRRAGAPGRRAARRAARAGAAAGAPTRVLATSPEG